MNIGKYLEMYSRDLRLKNYSDNTIENYCSQVKLFLSHYESVATKPSEINESQIKEWLLSSQSINGRKHRISALKLFYKVTGKQPMKFKHIEYPKSDKKLPIVLSVAEIQRMFDACENIKHKVILSLLYSCGLRVSEMINLQWQHIDRSRMIINIIAGKGKKDRQVMLDSKLIPLLENYYRSYKSREYVLNGQFDIQYSQQSVLQVVKQLADKAKINNKRVYTHLLRHCAFTHMVESGTDINLIQRLAGHSSVKTTGIYLHMSHNHISKIPSPLHYVCI
jgi:integrase/recombinase XerD